MVKITFLQIIAVELLNNIGAYNIDYIFMNTYTDKSDDSILSFYKDKNDQYLQISPLEGYDKFIASLAWALTTQEGYDANLPKYHVDKPFKLPADKLVFMIPSFKDTTYIPTNIDINKVVSLIKDHDGSFAGFTIWNSQNTANILDTLINIQLPSNRSYILDKTKKKIALNNSFDLAQNIDPDIIHYPNNIGTYNENTTIEFRGKKYMCLSNLELPLCNNLQYIPTGTLADLAWRELSYLEKKKRKKSSEDNTPEYPKNIRNYKNNQIVTYNNKKFSCIQGKQKLCNDSKYSMANQNGYLAWNDITNDLVDPNSLKMSEKNLQTNIDYKYPYNIQDYKGGTVVSLNNFTYKCKIGPESALCSQKSTYLQEYMGKMHGKNYPNI